MQILCFGDSITWGSWEQEGGWSNRLRRFAYDYVEAHPDKWIEIYNLGIPGDNTCDLRERFINETSERVEKNTEPIFIFAFGANDSSFISSKGVFRCPIEEYEAHYRIVLDEARKWSKMIFLLNITPVNEAVATKGERIRRNEFIDRYNECLKRIASEKNVDLIDVNQAYLDNDYLDLLCTDGLHPNSKGHLLIYNLIM